VEAFLQQKLPFLAIADVIAHALAETAWEPADDLAVLTQSDAEARRIATAFLSSRH